MAVTRLSGGLTPANGSDPRTFPAIWNATADDIEANEAAVAAIGANNWVTTARINDGAVTAPKLANTAGAVMVFDDAAARGSAIPSPSEGMVTYLKDTDAVEKFNGSAFVNVDTGKILQVVSTTKTNHFSMSGAYTDITGFSVTITPTSASSKILVHYSVLVGATAADTLTGTRIVRDSTAIGVATEGVANTAFFYTGITRNFTVGVLAGTFLDSPASTSALVYKMQLNSSGTGVVNRDGSGASNGAISTITVMEVAG